MRNIILAITSIVLLYQNVAAQTKLTPFTFRTEFTGDFISNIDGGKKRGSSYIGKIDLSAAFSTETAGWYKGGKLFVRAINAHGGSPSASYVGDIQPVSRIEAANRISLFEFWYSQQFGKLSILFGQFDMNSSFAVNSSASNFLNTSFGMYPSVALNVPLSIYPAASAALFTKWKQSEKLMVQAAVFDGAPLSFERNPNNIEWDIHPSKGLFSTLEIQLKEIRGEVVKGSYKLGGYYHNGRFDHLTDSTINIAGNYGLYLTADRMIIPENNTDNQGLTMFVQAGSSPGKGNLVDFYLSSGLVYRGLIESRPNDLLSLGVVHSSINNHLVKLSPSLYRKSRSLLELNYKAEIGNNFYLQPDVQFIINPGANPSFNNSMICIVRGGIYY
jgi:porin